jgi:hypothetical protein
MGESVWGVLTDGGEAGTPGHDAKRSRGGDRTAASNPIRSEASAVRIEDSSSFTGSRRTQLTTRTDTRASA